MRDWSIRIAVLLLLLVVIGVPFVMRPADAEQIHSNLRLVIVSPHNEQIRFEFEKAYNAYRAERDQPLVRIDWRSSGGTSDLRKQVLTQLERQAREGEGHEDDGIGYDLFFGGGEYDHNKLASGIEIPRGGEMVRISASVPIGLSDELMQEVFPQPTIGGERLYHPEQYWVGAALSNFGIVYNRDLLEILNLPEPETWDDLTDPRYMHWIALCDPGHSGSIAATFNTILRRQGWDEGWHTLRSSFANARYFTSSASRVPVDVSSGEAAAGMCIDFYGRYQAGAIIDDRVGYAAPKYLTATTADPISLIRGAPSRELAIDFIKWTLTVDGQVLWQQRKDAEGGPLKFELRRMPIRKDVYTDAYMKDWADEVHPFDEAKALPEGMPDFFFAVALLSHAMAIDVHDDLRAAWIALNENKDHPRYDEMEAHFYFMPEPARLQWPDDEMAANWKAWLEDADHPRNSEVAAVLDQFTSELGSRWRDSDQQLNDRLDWTLQFREHYRKVVEIAESN